MGGQVQRLRAELVASVSPADMRTIVAALVGKAKRGDIAAAKLLLSYTLGKPVEADLLERIEALEAVAADVRRQHKVGRG